MHDFDAILDAVARSTPFVCPARAWSTHDVRAQAQADLQELLQVELDAPRKNEDVLIESDNSAVRSWLILRHGARDASGRQQTIILDYSFAASTDVLRAAARVARERGSEVMWGLIPMADEIQGAAYREAGFVAEAQRIVLALDSYDDANLPKGGGRLPAAAAARALRAIAVRRASNADRIHLMRLCTECVPMMVHARRSGDVAAVQMDFFEYYSSVDLETPPLRAWIAETASGELAGALVTRPWREALPAGSCQAYLTDISIPPRHWGRGIGAALMLRAIHSLREEGIPYLVGDISTDNHRVWAGAERLGFVPEVLHYGLMLD